MRSITAPFKTSIVKKTIAARILARPLDICFLVEYPKSGGTWLKNMLASALEIPAWSRDQTPFQPCVMQAHWIKSFGLPLDKTIVMHRDGRDIMVSFYHHSYFYNDLLNAAHVDLMKKLRPFEDYDDVRSNLLPFMQFVFDTPATPNFSWVQFVNAWHNKPGIINVSYESLRHDTSSELLRILSTLRPEKKWSAETTSEIADAFTMTRMQKNIAKLNKNIFGKQKAEKPFIRSGATGGWSPYFTDESLVWLERRAGKELEKLGYALGRPKNAQ